jgi:hypothetical protein
MIEGLGFPHPGPLPLGEGAKGASLTVSGLILAPMPIEGKGTRRGMVISAPVLSKRYATATSSAGRGVQARDGACDRDGNAL